MKVNLNNDDIIKYIILKCRHDFVQETLTFSQKEN